jgi:MFS family permease
MDPAEPLRELAPGQTETTSAEMLGRHEAVGPVFHGPFRWLVLAHGFSGLAFWSYYGTVFAQAAFRFGAGTAEMAILGASLSVPFILGSLLQGLVVDRWSPKWLSFIGCLLLAAAVPTAWLAGSLGLLFASSFVVGAAFATIEPARSALTGLIVPPARLVRANGAISVSFQTSLVVGTLGGGALLDASGARTVYAAAFGCALLALALTLPIPDVRQQGERPAVALRDLRTGGRAAWDHPQLRLLLVVTVLGWTLINTFFVLEPLFVRRVLHQGGDAVLYLWGAHGTGALLGAIAVSRTRRGTGREATIVCAGVTIVGVGILAYTAVGIYAVALFAAAVAGFGFAMFYPPLLALIQRVVSEEQRGRVTGVFVALQETMGLVSSLALLVLSAVIVVRPTMVVSSAILVLIGLLGVRAARGRDRESRDRAAAA